MNRASKKRNNYRFEFGKNWTRFLSVLNEKRIVEAEESLKMMLGIDNLSDKKFLDIGSGSGLFSLAARRLGAHVHSFDYDPFSVACTKELKRRYFPDDVNWIIEEASVLNHDYLDGLGKFDIVYSWGVLHHTGDMWKALGNIVPLVRPEGQLFISIYNDRGWRSNYWKRVKKAYNMNVISKTAIFLVFTPYLLSRYLLFHLLIRRIKIERGMSLWHDLIDWIGGYPFEVAKPEEIFDYYKGKGFVLEKLKTSSGHSCNEYMFRCSANMRADT